MNDPPMIDLALLVEGVAVGTTEDVIVEVSVTEAAEVLKGAVLAA